MKKRSSSQSIPQPAFQATNDDYKDRRLGNGADRADEDRICDPQQRAEFGLTAPSKSPSDLIDEIHRTADLCDETVPRRGRTPKKAKTREELKFSRLADIEAFFL